MRIIKFLFSFLYSLTFVNLTACGGSSGGTASGEEQYESPSSQETMMDVRGFTESSMQHGKVMMLAGESKEVSLSSLGIEGEIHQVSFDEDILDIEHYGSGLKIKAPPSKHFYLENFTLKVQDSSGNILSEEIEIGIFPEKNNRRGWSLQGEHTSEYVNLIVLGDGYTEADQLKFYQDVEDFIDLMEEDEGVGPYKSRWAIHGVFTASADKGVDGSVDEDTHSTYFDSYYNCAGINRLICTDINKAYDVALSEYNFFDSIVMIINDERYGGAGGNISVFSAGHAHIALHELGHTFAGLADEYVDDNLSDRYQSEHYAEGTFPNISATNDPNHVPWSHWIGENGVGVYEGGLYNATGFYRPEINSIMRSTYQPFGQVNTEVWVKNIYQIVSPILAVSPDSLHVNIQSSELGKFSLALPYDFPIQSIEWYLEGELLTELTNQSAVDLRLDSGVYRLTAMVDDSLSIRRWGNHLAKRQHSWQINVAD